MSALARKITAEFIGTALLNCVVIGSGIMGARVSDNVGIAMFINASSLVCALAVLIYIISPISGAQFNPVVSLVSLINKSQKAAEALPFIVVQIVGAIVGAILANVMFDLPAIQISEHSRITAGSFIGEVIATAGLIAIIGILVHRKQEKIIPIAVAGWIYSAIFFTSSTAFANPAITIGRAFSNTLAGISPDSVLPFVLAELVGGAIGLFAVKVATKH